MRNDFAIESPFRLSTGGLFYRLLQRLRWAEGDRYIPWPRIALLTGLTWLPLFVMTAIDGTLLSGGIDIPFLRDPVPHARFLVALPLFFSADRAIDPSVAYAIRHFQICDLVPEASDPLYRKSVERLVHQRDALWIDGVLLAIAFGLVWIVIFNFSHYASSANTSSWMFTPTGNRHTLTPAGWWLVLFSSPFMLFILLRWIWRLVIWIWYLNRMSNLRLALQSTHPDQMGGLGLLTRAQLSFGVLFSAIGVMMSSTLASDIIHTGQGLAELKWEIIGFVVFGVVIVASPLCAFISQLLNVKRRDLGRYSSLAYELSEAFQTHWTRDKTLGRIGETLIASADPSALADYGAVYDTASNMRLIPLQKRQIIGLIVLFSAPFLPLILTQLSLREALQRMAEMLV